MFFTGKTYGLRFILCAGFLQLVDAGQSPCQMDTDEKGWQRLGPGGGGSVFYGPAAGVPGAVEDIENLPGRKW